MKSAQVDTDYWNGRRVFLTGHTGFKGGWLSLWLQSMGAFVVGYALDPPTQPNLFELAGIGENMTSIIGDIRDLEKIRMSFIKYQPDTVFHMAAQPLVRRSYIDPIETYSINIMGTANILEVVRSIPSVKAVVNITSDKCYENREWLWGYREVDPMGGCDPYSSSKGCAELVTAAYRNSYFHPNNYSVHGVAIASGRAGNVIGGGDWAEDRLIPDIISSIARGERVNIRNPDAIRPWQHVLEPLSGYLVLAERLSEQISYAEGWNFGPSDRDAKSVKWIVERLTQLWGEGTEWAVDSGSHPHEAHYLKLDCSKAEELLGWHPRWSLESSLSAIVDWYKTYRAGGDMREITMSQISKYSETIITR